MAIITFTNGPNQVYGHNYYGNNTYNLNGGEDSFHGASFLGGEQRDIVYGGDGNDSIGGGHGNDTLHGGNGSDHLSGDEGFDRLYGDGGRDTLNGWDGNHDELYGGIGNDIIYADSDKVNAGDGNDQVTVLSYDSDYATVNLGKGADTLNAVIEELDPVTIKVIDFKAEDHLNITGSNQYGYPLDESVVLDQLDANDDGWLGIKDVVADNPYDDFSINVGKNFLELEVYDSSVILQGMTKASFDFLV